MSNFYFRSCCRLHERDSDQDRYFRFKLLYRQIVPPLLNKYLQQSYKNKNFVSLKEFIQSQSVRHFLFHLRYNTVKCCRDNENCIENRTHTLNLSQWQRLYEPRKDKTHQDSKMCHCNYKAKDIQLEDIDISLAGLILLNCCKLDLKEEAAILSLTQLKKEHDYYSYEISDTDFIKLWTVLKQNVLQLDKSKNNDLKEIQNTFGGNCTCHNNPGVQHIVDAVIEVRIYITFC